MARGIVTLTTDFGLSDHFVGTMKGVILGITSNASIVDITHQVAPFEILEGAFEIAQAYRYFPSGTVHVVVVDPGVGTARRPILMEAAGQFFVAPDNGVLSMVYEREKHKVREVTARKYFLKDPSTTFHGRDVFAPVGAHLAKGIQAAAVGKVIHDYAQLTSVKPQRTGKRTWCGAILKIDRFGNLITSIHVDEFPEIRTRAFVLMAGLHEVANLALTFGDAPGGEPVVIVGSGGYLEVAINRDSAAKRLGCGVGAPVELTFL